jgi:uncharacterized protein
MSEASQIKTVPVSPPPSATLAAVQPLRKGAWGYRSYREHLAAVFPGQRIRKLSLDAGFTCPNLDGRVAKGGCSFCDNRSFTPAVGPAAIRDQWDRGRAWLRRRHRRVDGFIAYFQAYSNTYDSVQRLRERYDALPQALPECVGVAIGTRPDCLPDDVISVLDDLAERTYVSVEVGLQSDRDQTLRAINRGHDVATFLDAIARCARPRFEICVHLMLGLPHEGEDAAERMGDFVAGLPVQTVKIHNLHIVRGTPWAKAFERGDLNAPSRAWYLTALTRFLVRLRSDQAVQRIIGDAPRHLLLSEDWCRDKQGVLRDMGERMAISARSDSDGANGA